MKGENFEFRVWENELYNLQNEAPKPHVIPCSRILINKPAQYGIEYHGSISRLETEELFKNAIDGSYLVRNSQRAENTYTLVIWFDGVAKHFKLFYDDINKQHFVGETKFNTIELLVADGLIHFYVETRGSDVIHKITEANLYENTPFYKTRYHMLNNCVVDSSLNVQDVNHQASLLNNHSTNGSLIEKNTSIDPSFQFNHGKNYRDHPPLVTQRNLGLHNSTSTNILNRSPENELLFNSVNSSPLNRPVMYDRSRSATYNPSSNNIAFQTPKSELLLSRKTNLIHDPLSSISNNQIIKSNCTKKPAYSNMLLLNHSLIISKNSLDNLGVCQAPLATCCSSESSTFDLCTNGSFDNDVSPSLSEKQTKDYNVGDSNGLANDSSDSHDQSQYSSSDPVMKLHERYNLPIACLPNSSNAISNVKSHDFKIHTFVGPHWCDFCTHFIWGLVAQGFKCADCGFQAHKRCKDCIPSDCIPDLKQMKRIFGVDLTYLVRAENKFIPTILARCVEEIESRNGLTSEGLYRIPGNLDMVEELRIQFDKDSELVNIDESRVPDINVLASLIKSFFRQLPVPVITYDAYVDLMKVIREEKSETDKLISLKEIFSSLPIAHFESLRYFIAHINRVTKYEEKNMMGANNLAIILSPTLMISSYTDPLSCIAGTRYEQALISLLIRHNDYLLPPRITFDSPSVPNTKSLTMVSDGEKPRTRHTNLSNSNRYSQVLNATMTPTQTGSKGLSSPNNASAANHKRWGFLRSKSKPNSEVFMHNNNNDDDGQIHEDVSSPSLPLKS